MNERIDHPPRVRKAIDELMFWREGGGAMKQLQEIRRCMYRDAPRVDIGCLHCPYSLKIGEVWTCWYKPKVVEE